MKKRIVSLLLAAALLTGAASAAGEEGAAEQPDLDLSAASAVLMEKETGALLYEKESHQQLEPASLTTEELEHMAVVKLRAVARQIGLTSMTRKEIRFAKKEELLAAITAFLAEQNN